MEKKQNKTKFWEVKASAKKNEAGVFIYGEIVSGDKWYDSDVNIVEFTRELDALDNSVKTLNLYVNSPGGSVFTTIAMMSQLARMKSRLTINAYVDSLAASAVSFLIMVADNIYMYSNSMLMIHKPMIGNLWNANSLVLREKADWLDKVELSSCIPAYLSKATVELTEDILNGFLGEKDTWLDATEASKYFNIIVLDEVKDMVACLEPTLMYSAESIPKQLLEQINQSTSLISEEEMILRQRISDEAIASSEYTKTILGGIY